LDELLAAIEAALPERIVRARYAIPYGEAHVVAWIHRYGRVLKEEYGADGIEIEAELRQNLAERVASYQEVRATRSLSDG